MEQSVAPRTHRAIAYGNVNVLSAIVSSVCVHFEESKLCDHDVLAAILGESQFSTLLANRISERSLGDCRL